MYGSDEDFQSLNNEIARLRKSLIEATAERDLLRTQYSQAQNLIPQLYQRLDEARNDFSQYVADTALKNPTKPPIGNATTPKTRIHKYELTPGYNVPVMMPEGAYVLSAQFLPSQSYTPPGSTAREMQVRVEMGLVRRNGLYLWAVVDPNEKLLLRTVCIRGTLAAFDGTEGRFIGTAVSSDPVEVLHVFEALP